MWIWQSQHLPPGDTLTRSQASGAMRELSPALKDRHRVIPVPALSMLAGGLLPAFSSPKVGADADAIQLVRTPAVPEKNRRRTGKWPANPWRGKRVTKNAHGGRRQETKGRISIYRKRCNESFYQSIFNSTLDILQTTTFAL